MPSSYSPSDTKHDTLTLPSGGDPRTAASVDNPLSQLADNWFWANKDRVITPPTITSSQSNYTPTGWSDAEEVRLAASPSVNLNGLGPADRKVKTLINVGAQTISLAHMASGQTAGNQILNPDGSVQFVLGPGDSVVVFLDDTSGVWRILGPSRSASYVWSGYHTFSALCSFTQQLTCKGNFQISDLTDTAEFKYSTPRPRTVYLPITDGKSSGSSPMWVPNPVLYWMDCTTSAGKLVFIPRLPSGAVVTGVSCAYVMPYDVTSGLVLEAAQLTYSATGATSSTRTGTTGGTTGSASDQNLSVAVSHTVDGTHGLWIGVTAPTGSPMAVSLKSLSVTFTDPGPRNF